MLVKERYALSTLNEINLITIAVFSAIKGVGRGLRGVIGLTFFLRGGGSSIVVFNYETLCCHIKRVTLIDHPLFGIILRLCSIALIIANTFLHLADIMIIVGRVHLIWARMSLSKDVDIKREQDINSEVTLVLLQC